MTAIRKGITLLSPFACSGCRPRCLAVRTHLKYSLAYVVDGVCVLRFDNEAGKGDHFHCGEAEAAYAFTSLEQLLTDFWAAVDDRRT